MSRAKAVRISYTANDGSDKTLHVRAWKEDGDCLILGNSESNQRHYREGEESHLCKGWCIVIP